MIGKMWGSELIPARTEFLESGDIGIETILLGNRDDSHNSDKILYVDPAAPKSTPWKHDDEVSINIYYSDAYDTSLQPHGPWMDIEDAWDEEEEEADDEDDDDDDEEEEDEDLFEDDEDEFDEFDDDDDDDEEEADEEE